nr:MAG TPA: hypothetical protein [Caudoviricetes sp.]
MKINRPRLIYNLILINTINYKKLNMIVLKQHRHIWIFRMKLLKNIRNMFLI